MAEASYQIEANKLTIDGLLSVDTVAEYFQIGLDAIDEHAKLSVDLATAQINGSAGIALLVAWQRRARELGKPFSVENAPQHFLDMARISGVLDILPFSGLDDRAE